MKGFLVGAQLFSVRMFCQDAAGLRDTLCKLKGFGYNTCQLSGQSRAIPDEEVRDILLETGMKCVVTHNPMNEFDQSLESLIRRHKLWGAEYAGLGGMPGEYMGSAEGYKAFAAHVNAIADRLHDAGITFVYHNHAYEFQKFDGVTGMDVLFDSFGPHTQFELDTYWVQAGGEDAAKWIRKVDGRMDVVHFKDMMGLNSPDAHCIMTPVGGGNLDWQEIKLACEETHVKFAEVEQDNEEEPNNPIEELHKSIRYLNALGCSF